MIDASMLRTASAEIKFDTQNASYLSGTFQQLEAWLITSGNPRQAQQLRIHLGHIRQDLWDALTILHRVEWQREVAMSGQLNENDWMYFVASDVRAIHVSLRALYDHFAKLIQAISDKPGQVPGESFRVLKQWIGKTPQNRDKLGGDLCVLIEECVQFDTLRAVRDSLVHRGDMPLVFPHQSSIGFQVYDSRMSGLDLGRLMLNENVVDFELYTAAQLGQAIGYLERAAPLVFNRSSISQTLGESRSYHPGLTILKAYIERLLDVLSSP